MRSSTLSPLVRPILISPGHGLIDKNIDDVWHFPSRRSVTKNIMQNFLQATSAVTNMALSAMEGQLKARASLVDERNREVAEPRLPGRLRPPDRDP